MSEICRVLILPFSQKNFKCTFYKIWRNFHSTSVTPKSQKLIWAHIICGKKRNMRKETVTIFHQDHLFHFNFSFFFSLKISFYQDRRGKNEFIFHFFVSTGFLFLSRIDVIFFLKTKIKYEKNPSVIYSTFFPSNILLKIF